MWRYLCERLFLITNIWSCEADGGDGERENKKGENPINNRHFPARCVCVYGWYIYIIIIISTKRLSSSLMTHTRSSKKKPGNECKKRNESKPSLCTQQLRCCSTQNTVHIFHPRPAYMVFALFLCFLRSPCCRMRVLNYCRLPSG